MAAKGLVHHQGRPWGLLGSDAVDWLGSRIFPLRTAGLYRARCLEETGNVPLYQPALLPFAWHIPGHRDAFYDLQSPHAGLASSPVRLPRSRSSQVSPLRPLPQQCPLRRPSTPPSRRVFRGTQPSNALEKSGGGGA